MNTLELRKKLILSECEVRRGQLVADWNSFRSSWHGGAGYTRRLVVGTAVAWSFLKVFRRGNAPQPIQPKTKLGMLFQVALLLWPAWKSFQASNGKRSRVLPGKTLRSG